MVNEIQVAIRCGKYIKITAGNGGISDGDPILLINRCETYVADNAAFNYKCVKSYKVNYGSTLSFIKIELEVGGNISLFWVNVFSINDINSV